MSYMIKVNIKTSKNKETYMILWVDICYLDYLIV